MRSPLAGAVLLVLGASAFGPGPALGQRCGVAAGAGVAAIVGTAEYEMTGGVSGLMLGGDLQLAPGPELRLGYRTVDLGGAGRPHIGRATVALPLSLPLPLVAVCLTGHGAVARTEVEPDAVTSVAGGAGLRLALPLVDRNGVIPFVELRGLAARTRGTALGLDVEADGLSLGVHGGIQLVLGPLTGRLAGSMDGFDPGLGPTPYPAWSAELGVGLAF